MVCNTTALRPRFWYMGCTTACSAPRTVGRRPSRLCRSASSTISAAVRGRSSYPPSETERDHVSVRQVRVGDRVTQHQLVLGKLVEHDRPVRLRVAVEQESGVG